MQKWIHLHGRRLLVPHSGLNVAIIDRSPAEVE
jgi:hypothetical protein